MLREYLEVTFEVLRFAGVHVNFQNTISWLLPGKISHVSTNLDRVYDGVASEGQGILGILKLTALILALDQCAGVEFRESMRDSKFFRAVPGGG